MIVLVCVNYAIHALYVEKLSLLEFVSVGTLLSQSTTKVGRSVILATLHISFLDKSP